MAARVANRTSTSQFLLGQDGEAHQSTRTDGADEIGFKPSGGFGSPSVTLSGDGIFSADPRPRWPHTRSNRHGNRTPARCFVMKDAVYDSHALAMLRMWAAWAGIEEAVVIPGVVSIPSCGVRLGDTRWNCGLEGPWRQRAGISKVIMGQLAGQGPLQAASVWIAVTVRMQVNENFCFSEAPPVFNFSLVARASMKRSDDNMFGSTLRVAQVMTPNIHLSLSRFAGACIAILSEPRNKQLASQRSARL